MNVARHCARTREARGEANEAAIDIAAWVTRAIVRGRIGPTEQWICRDLCASGDLMRFSPRPECAGEKNHQEQKER